VVVRSGLTSSNPLAPPRIDPRFFCPTKRDAEDHAERRQNGASDLGVAGAGEIPPQRSCSRPMPAPTRGLMNNIRSRGRLRSIIRSAPARWGVDGMAVVDPQLRVPWDLPRPLRVVDCVDHGRR